MTSIKYPPLGAVEAIVAVEAVGIVEAVRDVEAEAAVYLNRQLHKAATRSTFLLSEVSGELYIVREAEALGCSPSR